MISNLLLLSETLKLLEVYYFYYGSTIDQLQQHFNMESKRIRSSWACSELFFDSLITPLASRMGTLLWHVLPHFFGSFLTTQPTFRNFQFWTKLSSHKKSKHIKEVEGVVSRLSKNLTRHNIQQKTGQMSKHWLRQYTTYDIFENYCISQSFTYIFHSQK